MHRLWEEQPEIYIYYCKVCKETKSNTVIINLKSALIINETLGEDWGAQWWEIYWVLRCLSRAGIHQSFGVKSSLTRTSVCIHGRQELISDVFWPRTCAVEKKMAMIRPFFHSTGGNWEQLTLKRVLRSTFLFWWLCKRLVHIPDLKQSTRTWLCCQMAFQPS